MSRLKPGQRLDGGERGGSIIRWVDPFRLLCSIFQLTIICVYCICMRGRWDLAFLDTLAPQQYGDRQLQVGEVNAFVCEA